jgi:hypothetical protein
MIFGPDPSQLATLQRLLDYDRNKLAHKEKVKRRQHLKEDIESSDAPKTIELDMPLIVQRSLDFLMEKGLNAEGTFSTLVYLLLCLLFACFLWSSFFMRVPFDNSRFV